MREDKKARLVGAAEISEELTELHSVRQERLEPVEPAEKKRVISAPRSEQLGKIFKVDGRGKNSLEEKQI